MYMYIDYNGYFYPKVLYSTKKLKFPDEDGNNLSTILLEGTGYNKTKYLNKIYKDCIFWSPSGKDFDYTSSEIYEWLLNKTNINYKGKNHIIIEKNTYNYNINNNTLEDD